MDSVKIVAISDTHNRHDKLKLPDGDLLIHSGDATGRGEVWEVKRFLEWYGKQSHAVKVFVPGNHDWLFEKDPEQAQQMCDDNGIILLNDSGVNVQFTAGYPHINKNLPDVPNTKIWGSPITPWFFDWAFNRVRGSEPQKIYNKYSGKQSIRPAIKPHWDMIPNDTDILVTHGPPYEVLDQLVYVDGTPKNEFVGCEDLTEAIKRVKPDIHIFGHIHCGYGEKHQDGVSYYNASCCDEMYSPTQAPHVIDYIKE